MSTTSVLRDSFRLEPPPPSQQQALDQAMLRAYSVERSVDYGCSLDDVVKLRRRVEAGHAWADVLVQLAADDQWRADVQSRNGTGPRAAAFLLHASAALRLAQAGLEHDAPRRLQAYEAGVDLFREAMRQVAYAAQVEEIQVPGEGKVHQAWLFKAAGFAQQGPAVIVVGGADGWCEAFHTSVAAFWERGLSVCLLELPGQGLARLRHGSHLDLGFSRTVSAAIDALIQRGASARNVGILGHSGGGSLAIAAAAADERIRACCSNGGSGEFSEELFKAYPRVQQRFGRMLGEGATIDDVRGLFAGLDLMRAAREMRARLLCAQGGQDLLVSNEEVARLVAARGPAHASLAYWPDGVHCIYNHAFERNCVISDWMASALTTPS